MGKRGQTSRNKLPTHMFVTPERYGLRPRRHNRVTPRRNIHLLASIIELTFESRHHISTSTTPPPTFSLWAIVIVEYLPRHGKQRKFSGPPSTRLHSFMYFSSLAQGIMSQTQQAVCAVPASKLETCIPLVYTAVPGKAEVDQCNVTPTYWTRPEHTTYMQTHHNQIPGTAVYIEPWKRMDEK